MPPNKLRLVDGLIVRMDKWNLCFRIPKVCHVHPRKKWYDDVKRVHDKVGMPLLLGMTSCKRRDDEVCRGDEGDGNLRTPH